MNKKTILITGVGGYIGSALAIKLSEKYFVIGYGRGGNFKELQKKINNNVELIEGDIIDTDLIARAVRRADVVIHAASPVSDAECMADPWGAIKTIIRGTRVVADAVNVNKILQFIYFSTQAVYSNSKPRQMPFTENMELLPDNLYGSLKAEAEQEVLKMSAVILRPSNIYGEGHGVGRRASTVIEQFVESSKNGGGLHIKGDESRGIDFIHVRDVVLFVEKLIANQIKGGQVFNVSSNESLSLKDLAELVVKHAEVICGVKSKIIFDKSGEQKLNLKRRLDNARAREIFPDFPTIPLEEGIDELLKQKE